MSAPPVLYGIPNCDTVKRARSWLAERGATHAFHDYKKAGVPLERLDGWLRTLGWERLVNRSGSTWRKLSEAEREAVHDAQSARALMAANASVIKRPIVEWPDGSVTVGFDADDWARRIG